MFLLKLTPFTDDNTVDNTDDNTDKKLVILLIISSTGIQTQVFLIISNDCGSEQWFLRVEWIGWEGHGGAASPL